MTEENSETGSGKLFSEEYRHLNAELHKTNEHYGRTSQIFAPHVTKLRDILLLPNYSVLIVCDDTKVVGNGVSDCFPFPGQGLVEEPEDGLGELSEIGIKPVVRHMPVHDAP